VESTIVEIGDTIYAATREHWRRWLEANHATLQQIWLVYYKKRSGTPSVSYDEAVEEALCFGWIDGIVKRIDEERYAQRYTPRRPNSNWSEPNRRRVRGLIEAGKMTDAGMAKIDFDLKVDDVLPPPQTEEIAIPQDVEKALRARPPAWENFTRLPPSSRGEYIRWITAGKREQTRARRLREAVVLLEQNQRLGMK
jgi:uncharacterized protein YdeI (YjbR/CyaY-like superfamily)